MLGNDIEQDMKIKLGSKVINKMSIDRSGKAKAQAKINYYLILVIAILSMIAAGCEESKFAQCEQIFQVIQNTQQNNQNASDVNKQSGKIKSWLQAANQFNQAAESIAALKINNSELMQYQNQLVTVYRIYSRATYDALKARENKNLLALKSARQDAVRAGVIQQKLIREINTYCLNE